MYKRQEPEKEGPGAWVIVGIIAGVLVVAGAAAAVFMKLRKKKKAAKLLAEDLMDLDQKDE